MSNTRTFARLGVILGLALCTLAGGAEAAPTLTRALSPNDAKLVNLSSPTTTFYRGEPLRFTALRGVVGTCDAVRVTLDGKSRVDNHPTFPFTFEIGAKDPLYPTKGGKFEVAVEGLSPSCTGRVTYTFALRDFTGPGLVTDVVVTGFNGPNAPGQIVILGHGMCRLSLSTFKAPYVYKTSKAVDFQLVDVPVQLPFTATVKALGPAGGDHITEIYALSAKFGGGLTDESKTRYPAFPGCTIAGPPEAGGLRMWKTFPTFASGNAPPTTSTTPPNGAPPGGGGGPAGAQAATGKITGLQVPGGSFAQDDTQKLQVSGTGGCAFDLAMKRTEAGASFHKTWPVNPMALPPSPMLYNGTHFETLAEGSYSATVTGKSGCTGSATIDFKVTPKNTIKSVAGKPTVSFEKPPSSGTAFKRTKDSNINFVVKVPQSVKDEPNAGCCDIEYDYRNAYGGWEVLPNSPFTDGSWGLAVKQSSASVPKSISGFTQGTQWRVKVRAYKFKTEFEWSDWVEFQVDQN